VEPNGKLTDKITKKYNINNIKGGSWQRSKVSAFAMHSVYSK